MISRLTLATLGAAALTVAVAAGAQEATSTSQAVGVPHRGSLRDGVQLQPGPGLRLLRRGGTQWGTEELIGLLGRAAARVDGEEPGGPPLVVGDLSRRRGGRLRPHHSHQSGLDADIGYYYEDRDAHPVAVDRFLRLSRERCARARAGLRCLAPERTFRLLAALLDDPVARVQWVLLAFDLRESILAGGRALRVEPEVLDRVTRATAHREGSESHRDHLHVRIYCPADDRPRCQDIGVRHPWYGD
jgi:penicillin-insensitive murein endopeptidase